MPVNAATKAAQLYRQSLMEQVRDKLEVHRFCRHEGRCPSGMCFILKMLWAIVFEQSPVVAGAWPEEPQKDNFKVQYAQASRPQPEVAQDCGHTSAGDIMTAACRNQAVVLP